MKIILGLVIIAILMIGCADNSPKGVVERFIKAVEKGDSNTYNKLVTPDSVSTMALMGEYLKESIKESGKPTNFAEKIDGDKASVVVSFANGDDQDYDLKKVDGKWLISMEMGK